MGESAAPVLEVLLDGRVRRVEAGRPFVIGRGPEVDLDLPHGRVSRRHAVVEWAGRGWRLVDRSRNGTFVAGERVTVLALDRPVVVRLGDTADTESAVLEFRPVPAGPPHEPPSGAVPSGAHPSAPAGPAPPAGGAARPAGSPASPQPPAGGVLARQARGGTRAHAVAARVRIGRLPDNDVVLDDLLVSRRHAELHRDTEGWALVDLGSDNGTFVNGVRVRHTRIGPADVVGIGRGLLQLEGDRLVSAVDVGDVAFSAAGLWVVTASGKPLLRSAGFSLPGRSLLAVVGPSGAGKSTLLNALTGARPADAGQVRYAGRDLYAEYDELRHRIGLVPQDDVLHPQLRVRQALRHAARLRFPADVTEADRHRRVEEVLAELGLVHQAEQRIDTLSGGQRKRTSVALELLTKPSLLFLDEPTSGLDPGLDKSVMQTLRGLADGSDDPSVAGGMQGRTVVVVTHSVLNLDVCDLLLVLAPGGYTAYFGPPRQALEYFGTPDFAEMFLLLDRVPGEQLAARYLASAQHRRYVEAPSLALPAPGVRPPAPAAAPRQQGLGTQLAVLCRRYLAVIAADRQYAAFLALLPLVLAGLARLVPGSSGFSVSRALAAAEFQPSQLLLVLILGGALMGIAAAVRELVKERPVYRRERAIGLSIGAYLASKLLVLGTVVALQAAVFTGLALVGRPPPDDAVLLGSPVLEVLVAVVAVSVVTMLVGLVVSAFVDNADRGMPLLVLVLMLQLVVSGGLFPVHGRPGLEQVAWLVPSRWAYAMGAVTADLNVTARSGPDPLWEHTAGRWLLAAGVLVGIAVVLVAVTALLLRRLDPVRR